MIDPAHKTEWSELLSPRSIGLILRSIRTDYKFVRIFAEFHMRLADGAAKPMKYPDRVTVLHKLRSEPQLDTDHFILDVLILSELHRRPAARCVEDIVVYDYKMAKKAPLYPFMVEKFKETWALQEQAKKTYGSRVTDLIRRTRELEKGSWDRPDAVEDLGSAVKS